jgi:tetratricopeptide (TPR) repeat protein
MNAKRLLLSLTVLLAVSRIATAQQQPVIPWQENPAYGATLEEREQTARNYSFLREAMDVKNYPYVLELFHTLVAEAPKVSENIYIYAGNVYKSKIALATSMAEKRLNVDSLMYVYDKRLEAFEKNAAYIRRSKAIDFLTYLPMDHEKVHRYFNEAIDASEGKDRDLIERYFVTLTNDFKADLVATDTYIDEYNRLSELMKAFPDAQEGQAVLDQKFSETDAASCEILEQMNRPKFAENPNDVELMKKIMSMMTRAKCQSDFMLEVAENLYKVEKSPETGVYLAALFENRQDFEKSLYYWEESINNEADPQKKVGYIMRAAASALASNSYRQAATFARQALAIEPNNGTAYLIIAQAYGYSVSSNCSDFSRQAAYWLVVDTFQRARGLLSGDAEQVATVNQQINSYAGQFPTSEECFFHGLKNGDSYTVNCGWISGTTTVRER